MRIYRIAQRTPQWLNLRAGKLTGSCAKDILAAVKSGESAKRRDLRYKLVAERLTKQSQEDSYVNAAMQWGLDHEGEALAAYEAESGELVEAIGFCEHDELLAGTSPDGFIGDEGILSIKCPKTATQIGYLRQGDEPSEHIAQNTHELWLTGRAFIDFVSFDPRLSGRARLFKIRVTRTPQQLKDYDTAARQFLAEVETEYQAVKTLADLNGQLQASVA